MLYLLLSLPLVFLGLCTVAAVIGSGRHEELAGRPAPPAAAEHASEIKLCA